MSTTAVKHTNELLGCIDRDGIENTPRTVSSAFIQINDVASSGYHVQPWAPVSPGGYCRATGVQRRAMRKILGLEKLSYEEKLKRWVIFTLERGMGRRG